MRFHIDADGVLTVTAKEESSGTTATIECKPMHGLTDDEVEGMLQAGFDNAQADFDARRAADLKAELGIMLRAIEKNLDTGRPHLDKETLEDLEAAVAAAEAARDQDELQPLVRCRDELEQASQPLAAILMDAVVKQAVTGKRLEDM